MASRQGEKSTMWLLWQFYLMSSKPLAATCYPFITLLWGDICDKIEEKEWENEPLIAALHLRHHHLPLLFPPPLQHTWVSPYASWGGGGTGGGLTLAERLGARRLNVNYWRTKITGIVECGAGEHTVGGNANVTIEEWGEIKAKTSTKEEELRKVKRRWREGGGSFLSDTRWRDVMQMESVKANCLLKPLLTGTKAQNAGLSIYAHRTEILRTKSTRKIIWWVSLLRWAHTDS